MVRLRVGHQFWPIPEVISTIDEPRGAFTIFVDSGPFHGLLLNILGSQSDFHRCETPRCAYVSVINITAWADFGPFPGLLLTVLGSRSDFHSC